MKRFEMIVAEIEENITEVSIVDTEEYNVELLVINCKNDDLFFLKETVETVLRKLNWQDTYIKKLEEENKKLKNDDYSDFMKVEFDDELGKCCHTCANCISDEEEYLTCIYDNELKNFDDVCDKWELDEDMV